MNANNSVAPMDETAPAHQFHIPVMGTGFTIDTPLHVAPYGISSAISLVDDIMIEQVRKYHCDKEGEPYEPISESEEHSRARRITAYLDLLDVLTRRRFEALRNSPFEPGSEITRYFELLPECELRAMYEQMLATEDETERAARQQALRERLQCGTIDVNIMATVDRQRYDGDQPLPPEASDASTALRGFAESTLASNVVLSAGMNPRLYRYAANFDDFFPDENGYIKKRIVLKVSNFRSAEIQGKYLAKLGLWVSEFRIESGLNCGGHAFPTNGELLGPILEEFKEKRDQLDAELRPRCAKALAKRNVDARLPEPRARVTAQGGIAAAEEHRYVLERYGIDGTGWGTAFLLVPEVTSVDEEHLQLLCDAGAEDVHLSAASPFGKPFWILKNSASERARRKRIEDGKPGAPCRKGFAKLFNKEFSDQPECTASRAYQKAKQASLRLECGASDDSCLVQDLSLDKACICHDLAGGVCRKYGLEESATPAICPGPSIKAFSRRLTLESLVGHIYGRNVVTDVDSRSHVFIEELGIYLNWLNKEAKAIADGQPKSEGPQLQEFGENLRGGIDYYRTIAATLADEQQAQFNEELETLDAEIAKTLSNLVEPQGV